LATAVRVQSRFSFIAGLAIGLLLATALIHLVQAPEDLSENTIRGILFIANGVFGLIAAVGIYRGAKTWGWGLGLIVAGGAFLFYVISRALGIPWEDSLGEWAEPIGILSLIVEGGFVVLAVRALLEPDTQA
jgi:hypothetical protein